MRTTASKRVAETTPADMPIDTSHIAHIAVFFCHSYTDFAGSTNFIVLAIVTLTVGGFYTARQIVVFCFVVVWGLRLATYLFSRILIIGTDDRFDDKRDKFWSFLGFWVFQVSQRTFYVPLLYVISSTSHT